jgi:molybdopterin/thiamine biosynthesis adenylyltransferase
MKQANVLVIGAGALGNEVIKNLALMGVGNIFIIDFDKIEAANLSALCYFAILTIIAVKREWLRRVQNL